MSTTITIVLKPNPKIIIPTDLSRIERHSWLKEQPDVIF